MNPWAEEAQDRTFEKLREETSTSTTWPPSETYDMPKKTTSGRGSTLREELIDVCVRHDVSAKVMKEILQACGFDI